jgi:hypothetical protein
LGLFQLFFVRCNELLSLGTSRRSSIVPCFERVDTEVKPEFRLRPNHMIKLHCYAVILSRKYDDSVSSNIDVRSEIILSYINRSSGRCFHQPTNYESIGTLAEWLTRGPAKLISSEACVRITQVSTQFSFVFLLAVWSAMMDTLSTRSYLMVSICIHVSRHGCSVVKSCPACSLRHWQLGMDPHVTECETSQASVVR